MCHILESSRNTRHIVIIPSATKMYMTEKIPYIFRQNSDFLYLTGCLEPDCTLVISASDEDNITSTLFLRKQDKHSELWDGPRTGNFMPFCNHLYIGCYHIYFSNQITRNIDHIF